MGRAGGERWSSENAVRHFKKMESFLPQDADMDIHGSDGELAVRQVYPEIPALVQKLTRQLPGKLDFLRFQIIMIPIPP